MMISVNAVEAVWLIASGLGLLFAVYALADALSQRAIVQQINDRAAELAAANNVRREALRLLVQALLLIAVLPRLFDDRETTLTLTLVALIAVPIVLLVDSMLALRDRRRLVGVALKEIQTEQQQASQRIENGMARIEHDLADNTALTVDAGAKADAAYQEANALNEKLVVVTDAAAIVSGELRDTTIDTAEKVADIHEATVHQAAE